MTGLGRGVGLKRVELVKYYASGQINELEEMFSSGRGCWDWGIGLMGLGKSVFG